MKVLFICHANVGRSQMAMEFYNQLLPGSATSAGTMVDIPGQKLKQRESAVEVVTAMKELGIDMSENTRIQLSPKMLGDYDKVVVLVDPKLTPEYLRINPKAEFWTIDDTLGKTLEETEEIRNKIKKKVEELANRF